MILRKGYTKGVGQQGLSSDRFLGGALRAIASGGAPCAISLRSALKSDRPKGAAL
jgi:hypothetical protein